MYDDKKGYIRSYKTRRSSSDVYIKGPHRRRNPGKWAKIIVWFLYILFALFIIGSVIWICLFK